MIEEISSARSCIVVSLGWDEGSRGHWAVTGSWVSNSARRRHRVAERLEAGAQRAADDAFAEPRDAPGDERGVGRSVDDHALAGDFLELRLEARIVRFA